MKIYLVGGAVRDEILNRPCKEKDWLVTGATPEEMIKKGYTPIGKDFPVFLHPKTKEEYALARTEKKTGRGYQGFTFYTSPQITVEEDLFRRDLTINAIAKTETGQLIDPYQGLQDIKDRILRHVSEAFTEDPLRVLRVARFAAQLYDFGFSIAKTTLKLMQDIVASKELETLSYERLWQETTLALSSQHPERYFEVLFSCQALHFLFPILIENYQENISQCPPRQAMVRAAQEQQEIDIIFTCAFFPWTSHLKNKKTVRDSMAEMLHKYHIPKKYQTLLLLVIDYFEWVRFLEVTKEENILLLLEKMDAFRRHERFLKVLLVCHYFFENLKEKEENNRRLECLKQAWQLCKTVDVTTFLQRGLYGIQVAEKIRHMRIERIKQWLQSNF